MTMREANTSVVKGAPKIASPKIYLLGNKIDLVEKDMNVGFLSFRYHNNILAKNKRILQIICLSLYITSHTLVYFEELFILNLELGANKYER